MSGNNEVKTKEELTRERLGTVGGQALIEGIMMNGPKGASIAVRRTDGSIIVKPYEFKRLREKYKFFGVPFVRGIVNFAESLILGYKSLSEAMELSGMLDIDETEEPESKLDKWLSEHFGPKMVAVVSAIGMVLGVVLAMGLFVYLPSLLIRLLDTYVAKGAINNIGLRPLLEGIVRIALFVGYIAAVSLMKDIRRVFMYHGAEHKTIFCYEHGLPLTVDNVRKQIRFHPRCGTSFIFVVLIISILLSSVLSVILHNTGAAVGGKPLIDVTWAWSLIKLAVLPVVVGLSYEYIRYAGKHENTCTKIFSAPGLWMQRLTTKEPDDSMIEVGIESVKAVLDGITDEKIIPASEYYYECFPDAEKPSGDDAEKNGNAADDPEKPEDEAEKSPEKPVFDFTIKDNPPLPSIRNDLADIDGSDVFGSNGAR